MSTIAKCDVCGDIGGDVSVDFSMEAIYFPAGWKEGAAGDICPKHDVRVADGTHAWFSVGDDYFGNDLRVFAEVIHYNPATRYYHIRDWAPDGGGEARDYFLPADDVERADGRSVLRWTLREEAT